VKVTERIKSEHLEHSGLGAGDCVVADGAYGYPKNLTYTTKQQGFALLRITWESFPVQDAAVAS
jgi:hypothetical protein